MQPGHDRTRRMDGAAERGTLGGRYRLEGLLGSGGMADVHRATDLRLHRPVAVKVFRPGTDPTGERRFREEAQTLANLRHPGLVAVHDFAVEGHRAYLVMELVEGSTLAEVLGREQLGDDEVTRIGVELADVLAYVHDEGVVHRDVKPSNILLDRDGRVRLADFGISRLMGAPGLTAVDARTGTASYLAPEQARGEQVGPEADVYALGLVLLEALTGRVEYPGAGWETADARPPRVPRDTPEPLRGALRAMTASDPARRPDARTVADWLSEPAAVETVDDEPPARGGGSRVGLLALGAVLALLGVLLAVVLTMGNDDASDTAATPEVAPSSAVEPQEPVEDEAPPSEDGAGGGLPDLPSELPDIPTELPDLPDIPTELPEIPEPVQDDARDLWEQVGDWWASLF